MFGLTLNRKPKVRRDSRWPALRAAHLRAFPTCASCGGKDVLEVHHAVPVHIDPSRELDPTNLITLCEKRRCHLIVGHIWNWKLMNTKVRDIAAALLAEVRRSG
jgi:5-methylcytosine-specific restriction endonuclease McrA